jgi:hypothetical protein
VLLWIGPPPAGACYATAEGVAADAALRLLAPNLSGPVLRHRAGGATSAILKKAVKRQDTSETLH